MTQEPNSPGPQRKRRDREPSALKKRLSAVYREIIFTILPVLLSLFVWVYLVDALRLWRFNQYVGMLIFVVIVFGLTPLIMLAFQKIAAWWTTPAHGRPKVPVSRGRRLVRLILAGFLLPLAVSIIANLVPVNGQSVASLVIDRLKARRDFGLTADVLWAIESSRQTATKAEALETLRVLVHSDIVDYVFTMIEANIKYLEEDRLYSVFSGFLAEFPSDSRDRLLGLLQKFDPVHAPDQAALREKLLEEAMVKRPFAELEREVTELATTEEEIAAFRLELRRMELELLDRVGEIEIDEGQIGGLGRERILSFVLDTFTAMKKIPDEDQQVYLHSRAIAADRNYPNWARRKSIALLVRLGSKADFRVLVSIMREDDERLRRSALEGLRALYQRVEGGDGESGAERG